MCNDNETICNANQEKGLISDILNNMGTKPFEFIDLTDQEQSNSYNFDEDEMTEETPSMIRTLGYLQSLIEKHKNGEIFNMTIITILKDERISIWLPSSIEDGELDELYNPIIEALKNSYPSSEFNKL